MSPLENSLEKAVAALQTIKRLTRPESGAWLVAHETLSMITAEQTHSSTESNSSQGQ